MPNDNSTMGERIEEKLRNNTFIWSEIPSEKGSGVPNPKLVELIQAEIQRAVGEREREIVELKEKIEDLECQLIEIGELSD